MTSLDPSLFTAKSIVSLILSSVSQGRPSKKEVVVSRLACLHIFTAWMLSLTVAPLFILSSDSWRPDSTPMKTPTHLAAFICLSNSKLIESALTLHSHST